MLTIEPNTIRCSVEIDTKRFIDLEDSESYVSGNAAFQPGVETLSDKLNKIASIVDTEYNGHFGAAIYFTIDADEDREALAAAIEPIINDHLDWCASLPKAAHVVERRKGG